MTCRPAEGAKAHRCASDTSKTFSQNACVSLPPSLVKTFRCDQGLCLIYHIEWIGSIPFSEGVKIQAFIPQITFGDTACAFIYVLSRYSLSPHIIWGNKHFEVSTDCCKLRVLARPYLKTIAENRTWARTGSPRDPGWEGVARTPCEHGSDVLVLCRRLSDVNS